MKTQLNNEDIQLHQINARIDSEAKERLKKNYSSQTNTYTHQILSAINTLYAKSASWQKVEDLPQIKSIRSARITTRLPKDALEKIEKIYKVIRTHLDEKSFKKMYNINGIKNGDSQASLIIALAL